MSNLKKHLVAFHYFGAAEIFVENANEAKEQVKNMRLIPNVPSITVKDFEIEIMEVQILEPEFDIVIGLIDHCILKWKNEPGVTYSEIVNDARGIMNRIQEQQIRTVLNDMIARWENDRPSMLIMERDLRMIRKLVS
jgi:hypothetical protein